MSAFLGGVHHCDPPDPVFLYRLAVSGVTFAKRAPWVCFSFLDPVRRAFMHKQIDPRRDYGRVEARAGHFVLCYVLTTTWK